MPKMKDSGIEWVGQIPESWEVLKNKYNLTLDKSLVGNKWYDTQLLSLTKNGIKTITPEEQTGKVPTSYATYQTVKPNDLIMCLFDLDVSAVFSGISIYDGMISPAYKCFKCNERLLPKYADLYFQTVFVDRKYKRYSKNVRYSLGVDEFLALPMVVPPIDAQKRIADFLDSRCSEINSLRADIEAEIETLEEYKKSVIAEAVTKGINKGVILKDSNVAWNKRIPVHWNAVPSKYLFVNSDTRKKSDDVLLTASQKYGIISQKEYMEKENAQIVLANQGIDKWKHVEPNDFIISLRSFQGGLEMSETTGCITWHYVVLKNCRPIYPRYYKWLFKSSQYINALQGTCNFIRDGQDLRYSNFVQVALFEPSIKEQKDIADYLDEKCGQIDSIIRDKREQLDTLDNLKKSLIYEYVTGKKEVPNE